MYVSFADLPVPDDTRYAGQGWSLLTGPDDERFGSQMPPPLVRGTADGAEALFETGPRTRNAAGGLHGGFLAAIAEQTLFLPLLVLDRVTLTGVVTIDFSVQYLAGGDTDAPLLAQVRLLRETGRMAFVRGELVQNGVMLVAYSATLRKLPRKD